MNKPLAVKYRPTTFDDLCAQDYVKTILTNQVERNEFQHSYLFTGSAGCGKTTSARIFANMINKGRGNPIEIDAASHSGVDEMRALVEDAKRKPIDCDYKVYIIDEVHSISSSAWQALLKLLEESPKYSIFIMCTTDPQKIPQTIISRVQQFNFRKLPVKVVADRLKYILDQEGITDYEESALSYLAKLGNGGMRASITLMDKCLALAKRITLDDVMAVCGSLSYDVFMHELKDILDFSMDAVRRISDIHNDGKDLKQFIKDFTKFTIDCVKFTQFKSFDYISLPETINMQNFLEELCECRYDYSGVVDLLIDIYNNIKWEDDPQLIIESYLMSYIGGRE